VIIKIVNAEGAEVFAKERREAPTFKRVVLLRPWPSFWGS